MVDAARRASRHRNLTNVEHRVMDAQRLDLEDASVDAVISRFTFMLVPEPQRVFAEVHRVLRAGGRFAYAVWGDMERNPWVTVIIGALLANGHALGGDGPFAPGGLFSLAAAETNAELLTAAGFVEVGVAESLGEMTAETFDEYWEVQTSLAGPVTRLLETLSAEQVDAVRASAEAGAEPYRTPSGYRLPYTANVVAARRPER
jgi:SAM-dependent methyltransferase